MVLMNYYLKHGQSFESFVEQTADELLAKPTGVEILASRLTHGSPARPSR